MPKTVHLVQVYRTHGGESHREEVYCFDTDMEARAFARRAEAANWRVDTQTIPLPLYVHSSDALKAFNDINT